MAGGRPRPGAAKFHSARDQPGLQAALRQISQQVTSCTLTFDRPASTSESLREVEVGGPQPLVHGDDEVDDCAGESGWRYTDAQRSGLELCGDACAQYRMFGELTVTFDCGR